MEKEEEGSGQRRDSKAARDSFALPIRQHRHVPYAYIRNEL